MRKLMAILALAFAFLLGACSTTEVKAEQTYPLKIWPQNTNGYYRTHIVVDEDTGVNYVIVSASSKGIAITPRLNADGSLYTSK